MTDTTRLNAELAKLKSAGYTGPKHPFRMAQSYGDSVTATRDMQRSAGLDLERAKMKLGRPITTDNYDSPEVRQILNENRAMTQAMGQKRATSARMQRTGMIGGGGSGVGGDVMNAIPRFYDPLEYWDLSGLPWNVADEGHRHKLHKWLRLYYATHYLVPILVDIFTRFPLVGMELQHEDKALKEIYEEMFLNQLGYEDFLVSLGREVWLVGEAFPLGSFVDTLGIWEHEGLINPEDVVIDNFPLLDSQQLKIVPPDYLRRIAQTKTPPREWFMLQQQYGDLVPYLLKGEHIPMSPVILNQVANKMNDWDDHGTPILLRGLRTLLHEEKLMASQDAIAERLYSPFILAKLGIMDMGDGLPPWLPTPDELDSVRDDIDVAMASDFRVMVHHFGLDLTSVFGREQMPRLGDDFDRIERRLMQVFGVNPSLLSAGSNSQPYASSALQAEFMNQILRTFQKQLKEHYKRRAMVVAEAQGHYEFERKGQTRVPIYETVMEPDEDGELRPVRKRKYTCPDLNFACLIYGTRVQTPSGPVNTESLTEGDLVLSWDLERNIAVERHVTHSYRNGNKPVYRVRTQLGREIAATSEHPFLTQRGWIEATDLMVQDKIRIGTEYTPVSPSSISERDARFLGLAVGDGCLSACEDGGVPMLANFDPEILSWSDHYVSGYGCSLKSNPDECAKDITQTHGRRVNPNPVKKFLRDHGLSGGNAWTKRVPSAVWSGGPGIWAAFLSGYLDADGTVKENKAVSWTSVNVELLKDCQTLLAHLNIRSDLSYYEGNHIGPDGVERFERRWMLGVGSRAGLEACQRWLDPLCIRKRTMTTRVWVVDERRRLTPEQANEVKELVALKRNRLEGPTYKEIGIRYGISSSTIWRAVKGEYDEIYTSWVDPQWDSIDSIVLEVAQPTWSLGIEGEHTHITEGLVTHNTFDLRDEATERSFLQQLRLQGVPIPDDKLMIGVTWKGEDYVEEYNRDIMYKTIQQQQAKMDTYLALVIKGLPVPMDLKAEVESVLAGGTGPTAPPGGGDPGAGGPPPGGPPGGDPGAGGMPPGGGGMVMPPPPAGIGPGGEAPPGGGAPPMAPKEPGPRGNVPEVSNERRPGLSYNASAGPIKDLDELAELSRDWPEDLRKRATEIWLNGGEAPKSEVEDESAKVESTETDDPETWELKASQTLETQDGKQIIVEGHRRLSIPVEAGKRYSLIDPLAEALESEETENEPDTEVSSEDSIPA